MPPRTLSCPGAALCAALALPAGALAGDTPLAESGPARPPNARAHALIMAIGNYRNGIPRLEGVSHDVATASEIARRMGVPESNLRALRDDALSLEGMRRAFDELEATLAGDDQVFIYFSGHGSRQNVSNEDGSERCAESLVSVDGQFLADQELAERLQRIAAKSQKTVAFFDACHSGGVSTRSAGLRQRGLSAKALPSAPNCATPTNLVRRNIVLSQGKGNGNGASNFVHIAAARDNEISFDQAGKGGVASRAWSSCLAGVARDRDGSGGLSAEEVRTCAQQRMERDLAGFEGIRAPHITITGNEGLVLNYAPPAAPTEVAAPSALAALTDIYNGRDDRHLVSLSTTKPKLKIGRDTFEVTVNSREGGYLYLLMVGSDGKSFDLLFPNQLDLNNRLPPGGALTLPRRHWELTAEGPPGKDTLLALVTDAPRDFAAAGLKPAGPFSVVPAVAAKDIQLVSSGETRPPAGECSDNAATTRNLAIRKRCSNGYGAALLTLEEAP